MTDREWTANDVRKLMANPKHCLTNVRGTNQPAITEELWIEAAMRRIREDQDGGKSFLIDLLENLKADRPS